MKKKSKIIALSTTKTEPAGKSGLVVTNDSVYEYDMDCLKKGKNCTKK